MVLTNDTDPAAAPVPSEKAASGTGKIRQFLKQAFGSWRRVALAAGSMIVAAGIGLVLSMAIDDLATSGLRASNDALRDQVNLLQGEMTSMQDRLDAEVVAYGVLSGRLEAARGSLSELCGTLKALAISGQFSPSGQAENGCGPMFPLVAVFRPGAGASVPMATEVSGTADVSRLDGRAIWFAVSTPGVPGFFPQGDWSTRSGPATITPEGKWTSPGIFVGQPNEAGKPFDIIVILATQRASDDFWAYLRKGHDRGMFPAITQLPSGATEYLRINVIRA